MSNENILVEAFSIYTEFISRPRKVVRYPIKRKPPETWDTEMHMDFLMGIVQCIKNNWRITAANVRDGMENKLSRGRIQSHLQKWKLKKGLLTQLDKNFYDEYKGRIDEVESERESRSSSPIIFETEVILQPECSAEFLPTTFGCAIDEKNIRRPSVELKTSSLEKLFPQIEECVFNELFE